MKQFLKISIVISVAVLLFILDVSHQSQSQSPQYRYFELVPEAQAVLGVRRRSARRGVVVGESMAASQQAAAASSQQQATAAPAQPAAAATPGALPLGTMVTTLPAGCAAVTVGGVQYQHCGVDYYRTAFQGGNVVYVTAQPN